MLHQKLQIVNKGSKIVVCARVGGANTTSFLAAHFAMRNTKNCGGEKRNGESEDRQKFLSFNFLPFCPLERKSFCFCRAKRGNQNSQSRFSSKKFGYFQIHIASWNFASQRKPPRFARRETAKEPENKSVRTIFWKE